MAAFTAFTLGTFGAIAGGDAVEVGTGLTSQRLYNRFYRKRHPLGHTNPGGKRIKSTAGFTPTKRPLGSTVTPSPKRSKMPVHRSSTIPHAMGDKAHGGNEMHTEDDKKIEYTNLRAIKLYFHRIALPPASIDNLSINRRDNNILLKGVKIHRVFHGVQTAGTAGDFGYIGPMVVNWALIQWNCPININNEQAELDMMTELKSKFFADATDNDKWWAPFDEGLAGGPYLDAWYDLKHINGSMCDKNNYRILARKRKMLSQFATITGNWANQAVRCPTTATIQHYFKMPQRIYLEGGDPATWSHPIYEIWWATPQNPNMAKLGWPTVAGGNARHYNSYNRHCTYFKEIPH